MVVKTQLCNFTGFKVYPGHGSMFVRGDGRSFIFGSGKGKSAFHFRKKPAALNWTYIYRRLNKKGQQEEERRRVKRRTAKTVSKPVEGASLEVIRAKRQQNTQPKDRRGGSAPRDAAMREMKARESKSKGGGRAAVGSGSKRK